MKTCSTCGKTYDLAAWTKLPFMGVFSRKRAELLEYRHCKGTTDDGPCGSALCVSRTDNAGLQEALEGGRATC